jgi:LuxR family transcriptional activator of conjugal transfer of Ti plasmids
MLNREVSNSKWLENFSTVGNLESLKDALSQARLLLGFRYFLFTCYWESVDVGKNKSSLSDCPENWESSIWTMNRDLFEKGHLQEVSVGITPILWQQLTERERSSFPTRIVSRLESGITYRVYDERQRTSLLTLILVCKGPFKMRTIRQVTPWGRLLATVAHERFFALVTANSNSVKRRDAAILTDRERDCLVRSALGHTASQIAAAHSISEQTVVWHLRNVRRKLGTRSSRQAYVKALQEGLLDPPAPVLLNGGPSDGRAPYAVTSLPRSSVK